MLHLTPELAKTADELHFTAALRNVISRLIDNGFNVGITYDNIPMAYNDSTIVPIYVTFYIRKEDFSSNKKLEVMVRQDIAAEIYDKFADLLDREFLHYIDNCNKLYIAQDMSLSKIIQNTATSEINCNATVLDKIIEEVHRRGDFVIHIPKLVDFLFKLGIVMSKDDYIEEESK